MLNMTRNWFIRSFLTAIIAFSVMGILPTGHGSIVDAKGLPLTLFLGSANSELVPLDPESLADQPDGKPLSFDGNYPTWVAAPLGTVLAVAEYPPAGPAIVHMLDGVSRIERNSFELPPTVTMSWLTRNGSRLIGPSMQSGGISGSSAPDWYVISTTDGRVVSKISAEGQGVNFSGFHHALFDVNLERLYLAFVQEERLGDGPLPLNIVGYDINTGIETGRIELPNVLAGAWFPTDQTELGIVSQVLTPGIAISPNGTRLAVVDPLTRRITTIDTMTMQIAREVTPYASVSWRERLANFISPFPQTAEAKLYGGTTLAAHYSTDGSFLYVTGRIAQVGETMNDIEVELLGVQRIILATGEIDAESLEGVDVVSLWVDTGRNTLYVYTYDEPWETSTDSMVETRLRRLDPRTLEVTAERELSATEWVTALPLAAD